MNEEAVIKDPMGEPDGSVYNLKSPSTAWSAGSHQTILGVATLCRGFLYGLNKPEVHGLPRFLELLKSRKDPELRQRGLITVSNHVSVMDDPIIWGVLPLSFYAYHAYFNNRWGFGSHDICFQGGLLSNFFTLGQVLPTHRTAHSPHGGPFQSSITEAIRMLGRIEAGSVVANFKAQDPPSGKPWWQRHPIDPFTDPSHLHGLPGPYYKSYDGDERVYLSPSRYASNSFGWIHIFPEGMIHQSPSYDMRYFKWGIARLILEPPVCPDVVPMWIEGTDQVMHESRQFPRFIPRAGKRISVTFGDKLDTEARFGDLRQRWNQIKTAHLAKQGFEAEGKNFTMERFAEYIMNYDDRLLGTIQINSPEVLELWKETALRVRQEVLKLRKERGWPDEDPKSSWAETWRKEGPKRTGRMQDGTWVGDT